MTPIKIIQGMADIIDPTWDTFPWTPIGATAWALDQKLPSWWDKDPKKQSTDGPLNSPCPDSLEPKNFKKVGDV